MVQSWCGQANWGNCGVSCVNCAVLYGKDDWKRQWYQQPTTNTQFNPICVTGRQQTIQSLHRLTLIPLTWRIWWAPNNASKWQVGFNSGFKVLKKLLYSQRSSWRWAKLWPKHAEKASKNQLNEFYCILLFDDIILLVWSLWVRRGGCIGSRWGNRRERDHWGDLDVDGWIILGRISRRWDVGIWTGLGWPRIETGGGRLWVR